MIIGNISNISPPRPTYIRRIRIDKLFGYFSYRIPNQNLTEANFDRLMILYGDNGSGKTTILSLVFCLLSPQQGRGEKTYIARTPFRHLEIVFDDGSFVSATKVNQQLVGSFTVVVSQPNALREEFAIEAAADGAVKTSETTDKLFRRMATLGVGLYFLADDRRVRTTFPVSVETDEPAREMISQFNMPWHAPDEKWLSSIARSVRFQLDERFEESRGSHHLNIAPVLEDVGSWIRSHVFQGSSTGEENATSIYLRVIEQITMLAGAALSPNDDYQYGLSDRISNLAKRVEAFTRFGLITPFPADKFLDAFHRASDPAKRTIATVIEPYIDGIEARLNALDAIRNVILTYVETMNEFLKNKSLEFSLQAGATIRGYQTAPLDPAVLSSGEKQLILLLSNTVLARDTTGIFLIDEPELSLNVKWQRGLVNALLRCSEGSKIQYLLASHSLELITQHKQNAVQLSLSSDFVDHA